MVFEYSIKDQSMVKSNDSEYKVNDELGDGKCILSYVIEYEQENVFKYLLQFGFDLDKKLESLLMSLFKRQTIRT